MASGQILFNIVLMTVLKLVGLGLSLILIVLQSAVFGTTAAADAYFFVRQLVLSSVAMIFEASNQLTVPEFVRGMRSGSTGMRRVLTRFGLPLILGMSGLALGVGILAQPIVVILAPGFDPDRVDQSVLLLRIALICLPLSMIAAIAGSFNFARRQFGLTMLARLAPRFALIPVFIVLGAAVTPASLTWALVVGTLVMTVAIGWNGVLAMKLVAAGDVTPPQKTRTRQRAAAVTVNAVAQMAMGWIDVALASVVGVGGVTIMFIAQRLLLAAPGAVNSSVTSAYYTEYSHDAARTLDGAKPQIAPAVRISLFFALPLAALVMATAPELIGFLLERGAFVADDTDAVAALLRHLSVLLVINAILAAFLPAVMSDDGLPMVRIFLWFSFGALATRIVVGIPLVNAFGLHGLATTIILASLTSSLVLAFYLRRRHGPLFNLTDIRDMTLMVASALVSGLSAYLLPIAFDLADAWSLAVACLATGILFFGLCTVFGLPESRAVLALVSRNWRKR